MSIKQLPLKKIRLDGETQPRASLNEDVLEEARVATSALRGNPLLAEAKGRVAG